RFVFWQQDIYSVAMKAFAEQRLPVFGRAVGAAFVELERRMLRASDAVVVISEDFLPVLDRWRIAREHGDVIENWAPLDELPQRPRDNDWAHRHGLVGIPVALYSGTIGLKHDPQLLVELATRLHDGNARVVVVSGSPGAERLRGDAKAVANLD